MSENCSKVSVCFKGQITDMAQDVEKHNLMDTEINFHFFSLWPTMNQQTKQIQLNQPLLCMYMALPKVRIYVSKLFMTKSSCE